MFVEFGFFLLRIQEVFNFTSSDIMSSHKSIKSNPSSPQRRPSGSIRRFIARHGSNLPSPIPSSSHAAQAKNEATLVPIRPEALRPYMNTVSKEDEDTYTPSNVASSSRSSHIPIDRDQSTQYLTQAANYASLANLVKPHAEYPRIPQAGTAQSQQTSSSSSMHGTRHRLVRTKSGRKVIQTIRSIGQPSPNNVGLAPQSSPRPFQETDNQSFEAAPRLSMSSVESSGGSEIKTPESMNANLSWQCANGEKSTMQSTFAAPEMDGPMSVSPRLTPSSPALVDMSDAFHHIDGLAAVGFSTAEGVVQSSMDSQLLHAASNMDDENDYQMNRTPVSTSPTAGRSATIKIKRPDALHKLPSTSYHTDRTVTPTTSDHSSLGQMFDELQMHEKPESSEMTKASQTGEDAQHSRYMTPFPAAGLSPPIECAASPDSWRTLLPEHDRFYIPSEALSSRSSSMVGSDILQRNPVHRSNTYHEGADDRRRWSNESNSGGNSHDNSRNTLYDLDGSFGGARAAFAPLKYSYDQSSRSLTSPLLPDQDSIAGYSEPVREQASSTDERTGTLDLQKRHASFSAFDKGKSNQRSNFQESAFMPSDFTAYKFKRSLALSMSSSSVSFGAISPGLISVVTEAQECIDDDKPHYTVTPFPDGQRHDIHARRADRAEAPLGEVVQSDPCLSHEILVEAFNNGLQERVGNEGDNSITKRVVSTTTTTTTKTVVKEEDDLMVEQYVNRYELRTCLPGFRLDRMILETKRDHQLKITAETKNELEEGVDQRFERKIKFGPDADLKATRAHFDGLTLHINVPRIQSSET